MSDHLRIIARIRPSNYDELTSSDHHIVTHVTGQHHLRIQSKSSVVPIRNFVFDRILDTNATQDHAFEEIKPLLEAGLQGLNASCFTYGQTGTGKTHTMLGLDLWAIARREGLDWLERPVKDRVLNDIKSMGIIPRTMLWLLDKYQSILKRHDVGSKFEMQVSYLEIYNDKVLDLLVENSPSLEIRESSKGHVHVPGLTLKSVTNVNQFLDILWTGAKSRSIASTEMNDYSSRSHTIFRIHLDISRPGGQSSTRSTICLVDLAGSENWKHFSTSSMTAIRKKELICINKSLSALGHCILALQNPSKCHVPYRDCKLTRILQDNLSGNVRLAFFVTIAPCERWIDETVSTLQFADRAMKVQVFATANKVCAEDSQLTDKYKDEIQKLRYIVGMLLHNCNQTGADCSGIYEEIKSMFDPEAVEEILAWSRAQNRSKPKIKKLESIVHAVYPATLPSESFEISSSPIIPPRSHRAETEQSVQYLDDSILDAVLHHNSAGKSLGHEKSSESLQSTGYSRTVLHKGVAESGQHIGILNDRLNSAEDVISSIEVTEIQPNICISEDRTLDVATQPVPLIHNNTNEFRDFAKVEVDSGFQSDYGSAPYEYFSNELLSRFRHVDGNLRVQREHFQYAREAIFTIVGDMEQRLAAVNQLVEDFLNHSQSMVVLDHTSGSQPIFVSRGDQTSTASYGVEKISGIYPVKELLEMHYSPGLPQASPSFSSSNEANESFLIELKQKARQLEVNNSVTSSFSGIRVSYDPRWNRTAEMKQQSFPDVSQEKLPFQTRSICTPPAMKSVGSTPPSEKKMKVASSAEVCSVPTTTRTETLSRQHHPISAINQNAAPTTPAQHHIENGVQALSLYPPGYKSGAVLLQRESPTISGISLQATQSHQSVELTTELRGNASEAIINDHKKGTDAFHSSRKEGQVAASSPMPINDSSTRIRNHFGSVHENAYGERSDSNASRNGHKAAIASSRMSTVHSKRSNGGGRSMTTSSQSNYAGTTPNKRTLQSDSMTLSSDTTKERIIDPGSAPRSQTSKASLSPSRQKAIIRESKDLITRVKVIEPGSARVGQTPLSPFICESKELTTKAKTILTNDQPALDEQAFMSMDNSLSGSNIVNLGNSITAMESPKVSVSTRHSALSLLEKHSLSKMGGSKQAGPAILNHADEIESLFHRTKARIHRKVVEQTLARDSDGDIITGSTSADGGLSIIANRRNEDVINSIDNFVGEITEKEASTSSVGTSLSSQRNCFSLEASQDVYQIPDSYKLFGEEDKSNFDSDESCNYFQSVPGLSNGHSIVMNTELDSMESEISNNCDLASPASSRQLSTINKKLSLDLHQGSTLATAEYSHSGNWELNMKLPAAGVDVKTNVVSREYHQAPSSMSQNLSEPMPPSNRIQQFHANSMTTKLSPAASPTDGTAQDLPQRGHHSLSEGIIPAARLPSAGDINHDSDIRACDSDSGRDSWDGFGVGIFRSRQSITLQHNENSIIQSEPAFEQMFNSIPSRSTRKQVECVDDFNTPRVGCEVEGAIMSDYSAGSENDGEYEQAFQPLFNTVRSRSTRKQVERVDDFDTPLVGCEVEGAIMSDYSAGSENDGEYEQAFQPLFNTVRSRTRGSVAPDVSTTPAVGTESNSPVLTTPIEDELMDQITEEPPFIEIGDDVVPSILLFTPLVNSVTNATNDTAVEYSEATVLAAWSKYYDHTHSCYYYFNSMTSESTWDMPHGFVDEPTD